jgi:hypothetical protein
LGDSQGAKEDFEKSLDLVPEYVQSLVKVASVHMELGEYRGSEDCGWWRLLIDFPSDRGRRWSIWGFRDCHSS